MSFPKLSDIDLIVYDFDGVMTDNRVLVFQNGTEAVFCNRADGLGVDMLRQSGMRQIILSTESNPVVNTRGEKLRIEVISKCCDKRQALQYFCREQAIDPSRVVFVGNDINDLEVMKWVGYPVAPADAHNKIRSVAILVTRAKGGEGVIRELANLLHDETIYE